MKLVIIDPGSGNLASVLRAFQKVAAESGVAAEISVTRDAAEILAADRVVLPGHCRLNTMDAADELKR